MRKVYYKFINNLFDDTKFLGFKAIMVLLILLFVGGQNTR